MIPHETMWMNLINVMLSKSSKIEMNACSVSQCIKTLKVKKQTLKLQFKNYTHIHQIDKI